MLHSRYIVVEDFPDDKTRVIYNGASSIEAQKAMGESIERAEAQCVLFIAHPPASQIRYPRQEKLDAQDRARMAEDAKNSAALSKQREAAAKRDKAKQLTEEARRLEKEAAAHEDETESPAPEQKSKAAKAAKAAKEEVKNE